MEHESGKAQPIKRFCVVCTTQFDTHERPNAPFTCSNECDGALEEQKAQRRREGEELAEMEASMTLNEVSVSEAEKARRALSHVRDPRERTRHGLSVTGDLTWPSGKALYRPTLAGLVQVANGLAAVSDAYRGPRAKISAACDDLVMTCLDRIRRMLEDDGDGDAESEVVRPARVPEEAGLDGSETDGDAG